MAHNGETWWTCGSCEMRWLGARDLPEDNPDALCPSCNEVSRLRERLASAERAVVVFKGRHAKQVERAEFAERQVGVLRQHRENQIETVRAAVNRAASDYARAEKAEAEVARLKLELIRERETVRAEAVEQAWRAVVAEIEDAIPQSTEDAKESLRSVQQGVSTRLAGVRLALIEKHRASTSGEELTRARAVVEAARPFSRHTEEVFEAHRAPPWASMALRMKVADGEALVAAMSAYDAQSSDAGEHEWGPSNICMQCEVMRFKAPKPHPRWSGQWLYSVTGEHWSPEPIACPTKI